MTVRPHPWALSEHAYQTGRNFSQSMLLVSFFFLKVPSSTNLFPLAFYCNQGRETRPHLSLCLEVFLAKYPSSSLRSSFHRQCGQVSCYFITRSAFQHPLTFSLETSREALLMFTFLPTFCSECYRHACIL